MKYLGTCQWIACTDDEVFTHRQFSNLVNPRPCRLSTGICGKRSSDIHQSSLPAYSEPEDDDDDVTYGQRTSSVQMPPQSNREASPGQSISTPSNCLNSLSEAFLLREIRSLPHEHRCASRQDPVRITSRSPDPPSTQTAELKQQLPRGALPVTDNSSQSLLVLHSRWRAKALETRDGLDQREKNIATLDTFRFSSSASPCLSMLLELEPFISERCVSLSDPPFPLPGVP